MSASLPSFLPETVATARPAPAARPVRPAATEDEAFTAHLRDDNARRLPTRSRPPARKPAPQAETPARETRSEAPAKPAMSKDMRDTPARPQAADRERERASDRAAFKREADDAAGAPANEPIEKPAQSAEPAAIAEASAAQTATDAALTIETAMSGEQPGADEAETAAEKNDSALAADAALLPQLAIPVPVAAQLTPDAAATADGADKSMPAIQALPAHASQRASGLTDAAALMAADTPVADKAPSPATPAVPQAHHGLFAQEAKAAASESGTQSARTQPEAALIAGTEAGGVKSHGAPAGLHFHLQPAAPDLTAQPDRALPPHNPAPQTPPVPLQAVPLTIGLKALEGAREFEIRLDPAELGRVDVKLSISEDGRVQASLVVDRVETLALLQRDARTLERAFDQAGLTADANAIQFSLRQDGGGEQSRRERFDDGGAASLSGLNELSPAQERPAQLYRGFVRETGVDIRV